MQAVLGIKVTQNPREGIKSKEGLAHFKPTIVSSKGVYIFPVFEYGDFNDFNFFDC